MFAFFLVPLSRDSYVALLMMRDVMDVQVCEILAIIFFVLEVCIARRAGEIGFALKIYHDVILACGGVYASFQQLQNASAL